jgi:hypothetical protein
LQENQQIERRLIQLIFNQGFGSPNP